MATLSYTTSGDMITTLHSLALRMLMRNHVLEATGRTPRPLNDFELEPLLNDLARHGGKRKARKLKDAYEAAWARLQHEQPGYVLDPVDQAFQTTLISWLVFHKSMLIGEVIPHLYDYLRSNPACAERNEFSHILVDEYQDLNNSDQGVIELLSGKAHVCIVGGDDQSIYSFRYAYPEGIREWLDMNVDAHDLELTDCRRCPTTVVEIANSLINNNQIRPVPRALLPLESNGEGDVRILQYQTLSEEIGGVADIVAQMTAGGVHPGDILVLAQRKVIGTPLYEALLERNVSVRSYYAEAELDSQDAQRAFALLKLFVSRSDRVALRWLMGFGSSTWNAAGYGRVRQHCELTGKEPWDALLELRNGQLRLPHTKPLIKVFEEILGEMDILESYPKLEGVVDRLFPEGQEETRDIRSLALAILESLGPIDRTAFLEALTEVITKPEIPLEINDVRVMSLHKSKGLSAPVTIIAGCVEGLLPKQPDSDLPVILQLQQMEEQRRLFYVGITRVKAVPSANKPGTLILTYSKMMPVRSALGAGINPAQQRFGTATLHASRFIRELGPHAPVHI